MKKEQYEKADSLRLEIRQLERYLAQFRKFKEIIEQNNYAFHLSVDCYDVLIDKPFVIQQIISNTEKALVEETEKLEKDFESL